MARFVKIFLVTTMAAVPLAAQYPQQQPPVGGLQPPPPAALQYNQQQAPPGGNLQPPPLAALQSNPPPQDGIPQALPPVAPQYNQQPPLLQSGVPQAPPPVAPQQNQQQPPPQSGIRQAPPSWQNRQSSLEELMVLLTEARRNYTEAVRDYTCTLTLREKMKGRIVDDTNVSFDEFQNALHDKTRRKLREERVVDFSCRAQPFSVYLKFRQPSKYAGKEICYVEGKNRFKNDDMVRMKEHVSLLTFMGFNSYRVTNPALLDSVHHKVSDLGIGQIIEHYMRVVVTEDRLQKTSVHITEEFFDGHACLRAELLRNKASSAFEGYRTVIFLEKATKMPVRVEIYDWPASGSSGEGELIDLCSYTDFHFNQGLANELFNK